MASMALSCTFHNFNAHIIKHSNGSYFPRCPRSQKMHDQNPTELTKRRDLILRTGKLATVAVIFNLSGEKPDYLGVQKNTPALALRSSTKNCISTSENVTNLTHYAHPWNYNPEGRKDRVSKEEAIEELIDVPMIHFSKTEDYLRVEYQSQILGLVDDVEFWFPPDRDSTVEYRSASRLGNFDFNVNRKRIKALRLELEKRGWASQDTI